MRRPGRPPTRYARARALAFAVSWRHAWNDLPTPISDHLLLATVAKQIGTVPAGDLGLVTAVSCRVAAAFLDLVARTLRDIDMDMTDRWDNDRG